MWILFALLGALMAAVAVVLSKAGLKDINSSLAFAIESVMILVIAWIAAFWQKEGIALGDIDRKTWWFLISAGTATKSGSKDFASRSFKRQPDHAARDIKGEVMGLRHREYDVKGLQFHLKP